MRTNLLTWIAWGTLIVFFSQGMAMPFAFGHAELLPKAGARVGISQPYQPIMLRGIKVNSRNPLRMEFIIDQGKGRGGNEHLKVEVGKLITYFLTGLTVPEKELWVNLSPYEKDRIIPPAFGQTKMGRDLLAQDYLLKAVTASLMYPDDGTGKMFWKKIYEEAYKKYGTTHVPVNTFNKVWIVPEKAVVYEDMNRLETKDHKPKTSGVVAYVVESKLKVMLEED